MIRMIDLRNCRSYFAAAILTATCLFSSNANSQSIESYGGSRLSFEGGVSKGRRSDFREQYNIGPSLAATWDIHRASRWDYGARAAYSHASGQDGEPTRLTTLSLVPYARYSLSEGKVATFYFGAGVGAALRRISYAMASLSYDPYSKGPKWVDTEISGMVMLMLGRDFAPLGKFYPGIRLMFDYHFTGDPTRGDFGDTGGLILVFRLGFNLKGEPGEFAR